MLPEIFQFYTPTKLIYGAGMLERIGKEAEFLGKARCLIVADKIITQLGLVNTLKEGLKGSQIEVGAVFDDVPPNSEISTVTAAAALGKTNKCNMIIAIGGGSVMDTAKVTNVLMFKGGDIREHMGAQLIGEKLFPMIFVPTTSGTGSEATMYAMISDTANQVKLPFAEDRFLPDLAVLDPKATVSMPGKITAATGMDALTHAIESYVSTTASPISQAFSLQAIEMISSNILQACAFPEDINARGGMLVASFMAGVAINHAGVGIVHAISHAAGGVYHIPHGVANSIFLPFSVDFNLEVAADKYARIAETMGDLNIYPVQSISKQVARFDISAVGQALDQLSFLDEWLATQKAKGLAEKLRVLNRQLSHLTGHPVNLRESGIRDNLVQFDLFVERAMEDGSLLYNPREVTRDTVRQIIRKAYDQDLPPIAVSRSELKVSRARVGKKVLKGVFKNEQDLYDVIGGFFTEMQKDSELKNALSTSGLAVRFRYNKPDGAIVLDSSGPEVQILTGDAARNHKVELELALDADLAHVFWHGQMNVVQALARREVIPKGNLPKAMKLLPILDPAFRMYPMYLRDKGLGKLALA